VVRTQLCAFLYCHGGLLENERSEGEQSADLSTIAIEAGRSRLDPQTGCNDNAGVQLYNYAVLQGKLGHNGGTEGAPRGDGPSLKIYRFLAGESAAAVATFKHVNSFRQHAVYSGIGSQEQNYSRTPQGLCRPYAREIPRMTVSGASQEQNHDDTVPILLGSVEPWKVKMTCAQQLDVRTPASSPRCPDTSRPTH
jgi:hypothetical protein